jgi:hypothetical protein
MVQYKNLTSKLTWKKNIHISGTESSMELAVSEENYKVFHTVKESNKVKLITKEQLVLRTLGQDLVYQLMPVIS